MIGGRVWITVLVVVVVVVAVAGVYIVVTLTSPPPPPPPPPPEENCDPAYPDVCIPSLPPDLDCGDIPYRNFVVLPPDPHRFDGDRDGIGCES